MDVAFARSAQKQVEAYLLEGKPKEAFLFLINLFDAHPGLKELLEALFTSTLCFWGRMLENNGHYTELFACYEQALRLFAVNEEILTNLGAHLFRMGYLKEASQHFKRALRVNNHFLPAKRNFESVNNLLVERWHFVMLNDNLRNEAYREAIIKKIKQGFTTVLDIGTGTGIFSLFANEGEAYEIYACDDSETMIQIAAQVVQNNDVQVNVKLINKLSNDIEIPHDIPHKVSLIVTETVDAGLFGENILQTLIHAWDTLLLHDDKSKKYKQVSNTTCTKGHVIPQSAVIWVSALECSHIDAKYRLLKRNSEYGNTGLGFLNMNLFASEGEVYDTLDLQRVPEGFRLLTTPIIGLHVNFNDRDELEQMLAGGQGIQDLTLTCSTGGRVDAFVIWFDLHVDEDIVLSSAPLSTVNRACSWEQAIFPLPKPIYVCERQGIDVQVSSHGGKLTVHPQIVTQTDKMQKDCSQNWVLNFMPDTHLVSQHVISFLNDQNWMSALAEATSLLSSDCTLEDIMDLSPFPVLGFFLLVNAKKTGNKRPMKLTCIVRDDDEETLIRKVAHSNEISNNQITYLKEDKLEDALHSSHTFDIILVHPIESTGKLNEKYINYLPVLRHMVKSTECILPKQTTLCCKLIYSAWLDEVSHVVSEDRVCGYNIAPFINEYQVSEHLDFSLSTLEHECYTETIEEMNFTYEQLLHSLQKPIIVEIPVKIIKSGFVNALPYWFKIKFSDHGSEVTTSCNRSFANQSAILFHPKINVKQGDNVKLSLICQNGLIHADVINDDLSRSSSSIA